MLPVLGKLALAFLGVEAADALVVRRWWRRRSYAAALRKAAEVGKPLLVVGRPQAGFVNKVVGPDYGCGDVCTDIVGCSPCPRELRGPLEQILPQLAPASHVIYVSCTLEYVEDLPRCIRELERVAVPGGLFVVRVAPGSSTFWLWPGAKWVIASAPPNPWRYTRRAGT
jgi:hypothetical protein